jgi:hypothetical protein
MCHKERQLLILRLVNEKSLFLSFVDAINRIHSKVKHGLLSAVIFGCVDALYNNTEGKSDIEVFVGVVWSRNDREEINICTFCR